MNVNLNIRAKHAQVEGSKDASTDVMVHLKSVDPVALLNDLMELKIPERDKSAMMKKIMLALGSAPDLDPPPNSTITNAGGGKAGSSN